jgi:hypothetical protein
MSKDSQLATRSDNGHTDLAQYARKVAQAQAQVTEKVIRDSIVAVLDQPVALIKGNPNPTKENISFARVGRAVVKIAVKFRNYDLTYNPARREFSGALPQPMIAVEAASEGDLIDMKRWLSQNGTGADVVAIREFVAIVRQETQPQPLAIQIVNAKEIGSVEKILTVKRDDSGKMTGAAVVPIN